VWSKISNALKRVGFRSHNFLALLSETLKLTGTVDQKLLLRNEYLAAENRILRALSSSSQKTYVRTCGHDLAVAG
jgi:hypothetical protein